MQPPLICQTELIEIHKKIKAEQDSSDQSDIVVACEHIVLGLRKPIERQGPTPEYREWINSASST